MSTYLVHYATAGRDTAVADEWNLDRARGRSSRVRRTAAHASPAATVGRVWERARATFGHVAVVPNPVVAR